ncbi:hypothetical protein PCASD_17159 [Puccinia coronata f. sp. avenae]|uniref:Uncharacterized protein n=1 Tax=Puccinia coronata f. sp. avenae TaxID=200324 RepID=A0A2N5SU29_9BASI|nr:hypothetical protein PCASD_17159 [Puccinia coronata f. sp. avenae]
MVPPCPPQNWNDLFQSDRLCSYGVPFFSIYLNDLIAEHGTFSLEEAIPGIASFALEKLLCSEKITGSLEITDARALALLGPTIGVPLHGQSHLNFLSVSTNLCASCQRFSAENESVLICCIKSLSSVVSQGDVDKGELGELTSRIILLCAMNTAAAEVKNEEMKAAHRSNNPNTSPVILTTFPSPVPVSKFLQTLTGRPANQLPLGKISDDQKKNLLGGMMFWNHFLHCSSTPSLGSLMEGLERGLAIQCQHSQPAFNQILPIYLNDESTDKLKKENLTFCGIQVKNREKDDTLATTQGTMTREKANIETDPNNPYLALHFSLRSKAPQEEVDNIQLRSSERVKGTRQAFLVFHGLQAFSFLSPELRAALGELLSIPTDLVSRHKEAALGQKYDMDFLLRDEQTMKE